MELTKILKLDDLKNVDAGNEILLIHIGVSPGANYALYGNVKEISKSECITLKDCLTLYREGILYGDSERNETVSDFDFSDPQKLVAFFRKSKMKLRPESPTYSLAKFGNWEIYCVNNSK